MTFGSIKNIQDYISGVVCDRIESGDVVNMSWATTEILNEYADISGSDADFYVICARHYVSDMVKRCIKKFDPSEDSTDNQLVLDGFMHLQKAYPVDRPDGRALVPITQLTDKELESRADEYDRMAIGCTVHAREIRKYIRDRQAAA